MTLGTKPYTIRNDLRPGDLGEIVRLHGVLYAAEHGFDSTFEPYVAAPLSEFSLKRSPRERIWVVERGGAVAGSVAVVDAGNETSQLRWLILDPSLRGRGLGKQLVGEAVRFSRESGYSRMILWTVGELTTAIAIYESYGFRPAESKSHSIWGRELTEQRYDLDL